ncbi:MAG TPA: GHKL domain-containing protein [Bacteroidales bacterium]|jgi:two-component system nitrogen regulation sensor histidine kinase NtrY|nr:GHKL domain-containing protein [Bacteroidales bacterium]
MRYRDPRLRLALYILLLIVFSGTLVLLVHLSSWYAILPGLGIIWVVYRVIRLFNRVPRELSYFLDAVENEDSTLFFSEDVGHEPTKKMHESLNRLNRLIQEVKLSSREQERYYGILLEQVSTGIVVVNNKGNILLANRAAKELLNYPFLTHVEQLRRVDSNLHRVFSRLAQESRHQIVKEVYESGMMRLSLQATSFVNQGTALRVISIHDIRHELDAKELESWQKLIRVLTHEIMNSITPITSLSETLLKYYIPGGYTAGGTVDEKTIANTVKGLKVINERGVGLIRFVESYRKLTRLSKPVLKPVALKGLIEHLLVLLENEPDFHRIHFLVEIDPVDASIDVDEAQMSQVFINLIKNAMQAVEGVDSPKIVISANYTESGLFEVNIVDNGPGISPEVMEQIFVPFFTTKESGSGIGLSLSRQIMKNHGGSIEATSSPGHTRFVLKFAR